MPSLSEHKSSRFVKLLFIGNSGAGKTGALTPLVKDGYDLRILDLDSGLDALVNHVREECPERIGTIQFETYRDRIKMTPAGPKVVGSPKAYVNALAALDKWPTDGSDPSRWGDKKILVIDSLTNLGRAAFQWAVAANPSSRDPRQWYKTAQDLIEDVIANVTSDEFECNVIIISHVEYVENNNMLKGYASSIGKALGPKIPRFFNTLILSETSGSGRNVKRKIKTLPTGIIDLKTPNPMQIEGEYDLSNGLSLLFKKLKAE
jgi:hypothetical protein